MPILSTQEISQIFSDADDEVLSFPWSELDRDSLVIEALRYYEWRCRHELREVFPIETSMDQHVLAIAQAKNALHIIVSLAYHQAKKVKAHGPDFAFNVRLYQEMPGLFTWLHRYSQLVDIKEMPDAVRDIAELNDLSVLVRYKPWFAKALVADNSVGSPTVISDRRRELRLRRFLEQYLANFVRPLEAHERAGTIICADGRVRIRNDRVRYRKIASSIIPLMRVYAALKRHSWEIEDNLNIGPSTAAEFRRIWGALWSIAFLHREVVFAMRGINANATKRSCLRIDRKKKLAQRLGLLADVSIETVERVIDLLTYAPDLYQPNSFRTDIAYQPLFEVGEDYLVFSPTMILGCSIERNLTELIRQNRNLGPPQDIEKEKEKRMVDSTHRFVELQGYRGEPNIDFELNVSGENGEIDLLIVDDEDRFALGCELKCLCAPENGRQIANRAERLRDEALPQCRLYKRWLTSGQEDVAVKTGISSALIADYTFECMAISSTTLGVGLVDTNEIPLLNVPLLRLLLGNPHQLTLRQVWKFAKQRRWLHVPPDVRVPVNGGFEFNGRTYVIGGFYRIGRLLIPKQDLAVDRL